MFDTRKFADAIGRKKMSDALGVLPTAVSNAVGRETFPPSWYWKCVELAKKADVECPPSLFGQRPLHKINTPNSQPSNGA